MLIFFSFQFSENEAVNIMWSVFKFRYRVVMFPTPFLRIKDIFFLLRIENIQRKNLVKQALSTLVSL